jgi:hypothetical protein
VIPSTRLDLGAIAFLLLLMVGFVVAMHVLAPGEPKRAPESTTTTEAP